MKTPTLALIASLALLGCTSQTAEPAKTADGKTEAKADGGDAKAAGGDVKDLVKKPRGKQVPAPADVAAAPADAATTPSGIAYKSISPGTGDAPSDNDSVKVQLTAWTSDGTTVETTDGRKTPKLVRMNRPPVPGLAEAINLGQRSGLDLEKAMSAISKGAAQSWQMENRWKAMVEGKFEFGFAVDWMRKDLGIAIAEANRAKAQVPLVALVDQFYARVQARGGNRWDTCSLIDLLQKA